MATWSKKIKRAREEKGWSQEDLAERIGTATTQNTISRWENGISKPNSHYRQRLSEVLGKSIEELGFLEKIEETLPESEPSESERQEFPPPQPPEAGQGYRPAQTPPIANTPRPFFRRLEVIISLIIVGVIVGVLIFLISISQTETVTFPLTAGSNGATTKRMYSGTTTITVSGTGQAAAKFYSDAFYLYADDKKQPIEPKHFTQYLSLCINGLPVDRFVQKIPLPSTDHFYKFQINAPGGHLTFGICDSESSDNTGSFTVTVSQGIFAIFT